MQKFLSLLSKQSKNGNHNIVKYDDDDFDMKFLLYIMRMSEMEISSKTVVLDPIILYSIHPLCHKILPQKH